MPRSARTQTGTWGHRAGRRAPAAPHLAQLLVDELLQLGGFLRRQRHAGAGASPPILSASGAPTTRPARPGVLVAVEHKAGATTSLLQLPRDAAPRQGWNPAGTVTAAATAPNCSFKTAVNEASGLSPAVPDHLHLPLSLSQGTHSAT